jgi:hypothetical protein
MARVFRAVMLTLALCSAWLQAAELQKHAPSTWKLGTPIVAYWDGPKLTDVLAQQVAEGGWNLVLIKTVEELDVAQRHDLRARRVIA